jgi:hypothetical protein
MLTVGELYRSVLQKLAQPRVNPRPIGRGYKREPRSGSNPV